MAGKLKAEIKQTRPFRTLEQEALLNLMRTAQVVAEPMERLFHEHGISTTQYNVLRILRGAGEGLACKEIADRMINNDPDVTRLLDRLEKLRLVKRTRSKTDRRVVLTHLEPKALELLGKLDDPVIARIGSLLSHMGHERLTQFIDLLEDARSIALQEKDGQAPTAAFPDPQGP